MSDDKQLQLIPETPFTPPPQFEVLWELLPQVTSIAVISEYLKKRNLTHSAGSWVELREKRLLPALQKGEIATADLTELLSQSEEFGRSHTFLFTCTKKLAAERLDLGFVEKTAAQLGLTDCIGTGKVLNQPDEPTITSIRLEEDARGKSLVIKIIEKRIHHKYIRETVEGKKLVREWDISEARAVNVIRLWSFGLVEVRIASHYNSTRYDGDVKRIRKLAEAFIPAIGLDDFSLGKTKIELWTNRKKYSELVRFSSSTLRDDSGGTISASAGAEGEDLFENKGLSDGLGAYWKHGNAHCESSNIYWLTAEGRLPSKEIHVILPELRNEFAVPANCSKMDYEYVFDQLRALSS